jgi:signal peptidase I
MREVVQRRPLTALILSFLTAGLGQLYNGQLKRAVSFYLLGLLVIIIVSFSGLLFSFFGMLTCAAILIGYTIFVMIDAFINAKRLHTIKPKGYNKWYLYLVIFLINAFLINPLIKSFIPPVKAYKLPAGSMAPTLMVGDHIIVDKKCYTNKNPERGDVVIFPDPKDPKKDYVKRAVGLPGETIEIRENQVYINGQPLEESYIQAPGKLTDSTYRVAGSEFGSVTVPDGKLFVLGDNRDNSLDSRHFGFVDMALLKGKALYIYWAQDKERIGKNIK